MFRSAHPSLRDCSKVECVKEPSGRRFWMVGLHDAERVLHTHACDWEIHVRPQFSSPIQASLGWCPTIREKPFQDRLDSRKFLSDAHLEMIQEFFPDSIGIHVLVTGFMVVLFPDATSAQASFQRGLVEEIGGLQVTTGVTSYVSTAVHTGHAIADIPGKIHQTACLGRRLRLPSGTDCITTATHAFVKLKKVANSRLRFQSWLAATKEALKFLRPRKFSRTVPRVCIGDSEPKTNSPLNKSCYLANSTIRVGFLSLSLDVTQGYAYNFWVQIGTITKTYDISSRIGSFPYPNGFQHDLSLVTGPDLPQLVNPPCTPRIIDWASPEEALLGGPLFLVCQDRTDEGFKVHTGNPIQPETQRALVLGAAYFWDRESRQPSRSFLWRSIPDGVNVVGASGSVLALGRPTDSTARAIVFQNFEFSLNYSASVAECASLNPQDMKLFPTAKGGFILPKEITDSTILAPQCSERPHYPSVNETQRYAQGSKQTKRNFTT